MILQAISNGGPLSSHTMSRASASDVVARELIHVAFVILLFGLTAWPSPGSAASMVLAPSGCGPAPTTLENPPEMTRVEGQTQTLELEARQDGERLCFVDRNKTKAFPVLTCFEFQRLSPTFDPGHLRRIFQGRRRGATPRWRKHHGCRRTRRWPRSQPE